MSPTAAIPADPKPAPAAGDAVSPAARVEDDATPRTGMTGLVAARLAAKGHAPVRATPATGPVLAAGKPVPGAAAWRALERHASSFRLR